MKIIETLSDWWVERKIKKCFKLRNDLQSHPAMTVPIEIIHGKYKGLVYQYGTMKIDENKISYHYDVIENSHLVDDNFIRFGGNVLTYLVVKKSCYDIISNSNEDDE